MTNDIMDLVSYDEVTVKLEIMGQKDNKPVKTGVVFEVRDTQNADTEKVKTRLRHISIGKRINNNEPMSDEDVGSTFAYSTTEPTDEMLAYCVVGWDWGSKSLGDIPVDKFDRKAVIDVFKAAPWIRKQVLAKALEITDFGRA